MASHAVLKQTLWDLRCKRLSFMWKNHLTYLQRVIKVKSHALVQPAPFSLSLSFSFLYSTRLSLCVSVFPSDRKHGTPILKIAKLFNNLTFLRCIRSLPALPQSPHDQLQITTQVCLLMWLLMSSTSVPLSPPPVVWTRSGLACFHPAGFDGWVGRFSGSS